jgi:hypothetical protein
LSAVLNSDVINELIKPLQPRGSFGARHIQRLPLEFPIPKFNPNDEIHKKLAELSKKCHEIMKKHKFKSKSSAGRRKEAKKLLKNEIDEINELVKKLLNL